MTPPAAEELLNVIMLDDFVARRKALDAWTRRWIATMEVDYVWDGGMSRAIALAIGRRELLKEMARSFAKDEVSALGWVEDERALLLRLHVLLQKPRAP